MRTLTHATLDEEDTDDGPWFCLWRRPFFCGDCKQVQSYLHIQLPQRLIAIVVFPEKDDEFLLECAIQYQRNRLNPRVIEYDPDFGLSISIEDVCRMVGIV